MNRTFLVGGMALALALGMALMGNDEQAMGAGGLFARCAGVGCAGAVDCAGVGCVGARQPRHGCRGARRAQRHHRRACVGVCAGVACAGVAQPVCPPVCGHPGYGPGMNGMAPPPPPGDEVPDVPPPPGPGV